MSDTEQDIPQITAKDEGLWLDGNQGWHNTHRVVDLAKTQGEYEAGSTDPGVCEAMHEAAEDATAYLQSKAPEGYVFDWDCGELNLVPGNDELDETSPVSEWPLDTEPELPTERQIEDWNTHNDHADCLVIDEPDYDYFYDGELAEPADPEKGE